MLRPPLDIFPGSNINRYAIGNLWPIDYSIKKYYFLLQVYFDGMPQTNLEKFDAAVKNILEHVRKGCLSRIKPGKLFYFDTPILVFMMKRLFSLRRYHEARTHR